MELVDANIILRYLLKDHKQHFKEAQQLLENRLLFVPFEVVAEVVYVLEKVYNVPFAKIRGVLEVLFDYNNLIVSDKTVLKKALEIYETKNVDFVDCLLIAYDNIHHYTVHSFDKRLNYLLRSA